MSYSYYAQFAPVNRKRYKDRMGRSLMNRKAADLPLPPRNPAYETVEAVVYSGHTMKIDELKFTRVKRETSFGKIKPVNLARLLSSVLEPESDHENDEDETGSQDLSGFLDRSGDFGSGVLSPGASGTAPNDSDYESLLDDAMLARLKDMGMDVSDIANKIHGHADARVSHGKQEVDHSGGLTTNDIDRHDQQQEECFFLLVDVREEDEYEKCHILGAMNFPASLLTRSMGYLDPRIASFKGREDRAIIVYAVEEKRSITVANILFERGYDNIMVLSGGMKAFVTQIPRELLSAPPPPEAVEHGPGEGRGRGKVGSVKSFRTVGTRRSTATMASRRSTVSTASTSSFASRSGRGGRGRRGASAASTSTRAYSHPTEALVSAELRKLRDAEIDADAGFGVGVGMEHVPVSEKKHVPKVMGVNVRGRGGGRGRGRGRGGLGVRGKGRIGALPTAGTALERAIQEEKAKRLSGRL